VRRLEWAGNCCEFKVKREWVEMERRKNMGCRFRTLNKRDFSNLNQGLKLKGRRFNFKLNFGSFSKI
jgi:hypothetical protein